MARQFRFWPKVTPVRGSTTCAAAVLPDRAAGEHGGGWPVDVAEAGAVGGFFALRTSAPPGGAHLPLSRIYAGDSAPLAARLDTRRRPARRPGTQSRRVRGASGDGRPTVVHRARLRRPVRRRPRSRPAAAALGPGSSPRPVICGWPVSGNCPPRPTVCGRPSSTVTSSRSPRRWVAIAGSRPACCGATRVPRWRARYGELRVWAEGNGRTDVGELAASLAGELFDHPDLRATGDTAAGSFRRRSCCLYYRCAAGGLCGDCVFDRPPPRSSARRGSG